MLRQVRRSGAGALLGAVAVFAPAPPASAEGPPLAHRMPPEPMLYVGWAGADDLSAAYDASKLKRVVEDTGLLERWEPMVSALLARTRSPVEPDDPEAAARWAELEPMLGAAWHRPWALAIDRVDFTGDPPTGRLVWVIDAGPRAERVAASIDALVEAAEEEMPELPIAEFHDDGVVGLVVGTTDSAGLTGYTPPAFANRATPGAAFLAHLHADRLYDQIVRGGEAHGHLDAEERALLERIGLDDLGTAVFAAGFEGPDWRTETHLESPAPRRGILSLIEGEPIAPAAWSLIPPTATWARLHRFGPREAFDLLQQAVTAAGDREDFRDALARARAELGFDFEADVIDPLGDVWAIYSEPTFSSSFGPGICIVNELRDADRFAATLATLRERINTEMRDNGSGFQIAELDLGEVTVDTLAFPFLTLTWAVADGRFYLAMSPDAVLTAHEAASDPTRSLARSEKLVRVRQRLRELARARSPEGGLEPVGVMFADLAGSAVKMVPLYAMLLNFASGPLMQETGVNAMSLLPPLGRILPHLEPAGAMTWFGPEGMHSVSLSPFPGSLLMSPEATWSSRSAGTAMALGVVLPALDAARGSAREITRPPPLHAIQQRMITWGAAHDNRSPPSLYAMWKGGYLPLELVVSPAADTPLPKDFPAWGEDEQRQWFQRNASYVMIPWAKQTVDGGKVALFEKPADAANPEVIGVAFEDNTALQRPHAWVATRIREQTGASLEAWIEAAERGETPSAFDPSGPRTIRGIRGGATRIRPSPGEPEEAGGAPPP